jgi:LEA14-like dessication related protein
MKFRLLGFLVIVFASSCKQQDVVFKGVSNPQIKEMSLTKATIVTNAIMYNPNGQGGKVKDVEIVVKLNGEEVAMVTEVSKIRVKPKSTFEVPLQVEIPLTSKAISGGFMDVLKGKKSRISYKGTITFRTFMISYDVPIDMEENIKLNLF